MNPFGRSVSTTQTVPYLLAALLTIAATSPPTWAESDPPPISQQQAVIPLAAIDRLEMPPIDVERLRAEDLIHDKSLTPSPTRFAAPIEVTHNLSSAGTWEDLADGSRLWRLRIASPGALSLNLGLSRFDIPAGAQLWLYDANLERVEGPYTRRHRAPDGQLWTPVLIGDEIVLELHLPAGVGDARLEIGSVNHGYRFFGEPVSKQGSCNIDVICPEVDLFRDQVRAVARYTRSGTLLCTGNLLNNTAQDFRPFFLTADHCGINVNNASSVVVYWNFESPTCGQLDGGSLDDNQTGATFRASHFQTDTALIELNQTPDTESNVFYAGWDVEGAVPQSVVGIHHPAGDEKAAAFEGDPLFSVDIGRGGQTHWQVAAWDLGTTEGGSSGSCIFDQSSKACVGHLTGGLASCTNPGGFDVYGKLSLAWAGGGTDATRLSNWLDPVGGGTTTSLAGSDPIGNDTSFSGLIVPGFEASAVDPEGPTTFFAVRNTSEATIDVNVHYYSEQLTAEPLRTDAFPLAPQQTLSQNIGQNLEDLQITDGFATGLVVIRAAEEASAEGLEGDYFRVDSGNDFAAGDRLVRLADFCARQEIRFVDFGSGSQLRVLLDDPPGGEVAAFSYTAYNEAGQMIDQGNFTTANHLNVIDVSDLVESNNFGTLLFDFTNSTRGFVSARYSAFGRFSLELNGACR